MENYAEWTQIEIIHCPIKECKGMLLQHPYFCEMKCSDCNKYFIKEIKFKEIKK